MSWQTIIAVGLGGFIGAILRLYLTSVINKSIEHTLPIGTLSVNLIGSFILGSLLALFANSTFFSLPVKSFLTTGMMGALTTYSTFAMESFFLLNQNFILGISNILFNLIGTIFMAGFGFKSIEYILK